LFEQICSLFYQNDEILIDKTNAQQFKYLSGVLENDLLKESCLNVEEARPSIFKFSSERFGQIPSSDFSSLDNFKIFIDDKIIESNLAFTCCLSQRLFNLVLSNSELQSLDFDDVETNSEQFSRLSIYSIENLLSSSYLVLPSENFLFNLIEKDRRRIKLRRFLISPALDFEILKVFLHELKFEECDAQLFESLKNLFIFREDQISLNRWVENPFFFQWNALFNVKIY
jgi:hypothetical protein